MRPDDSIAEPRCRAFGEPFVREYLTQFGERLTALLDDVRALVGVLGQIG